jgi:glycerophosphoryl diester phosphodiesterase
MVLHGGSEGELSSYGMPDQLAYEWTCDELQSDKIDIGEGQRIPTLAQVLDLCQDKDDMLINIELKAPWEMHNRVKYDYHNAVRVVYDMIMEQGIGHKVQVSSFIPEMIESLVHISKVEGRDFIISSLAMERQDIVGDTDGVNQYIIETDEAENQK